MYQNRGRLEVNVAYDKPSIFSSGDLSRFTSNFSIKIDSGAFGGIYKGILHNGAAVAVKVLIDKDITQEIFMAEVSTMCKIHHRYLVKLYGFCFDDSVKGLVYEYMENGSLDKILYEKRHGLDWDKLYAIAIETAKGIAYLHDGCDVQIIHHDIKPSNILLDSDFSPKISDFGLAKLLNRDKSHYTNTRTRGTPGYAAPEMWVPSSKITPKCDVYSFGMLLFEILETRINRQNKNWFPKQVWEKVEIRQLDETIKDWGIVERSREKAKRLCMVALWCAQYAPHKRPSMSKVVLMLENEMPVITPPNPFITSSDSSVSPLQVSLHKKDFQESSPELSVYVQKYPKENSEKASTSQIRENNTARDSNSMLETFEKKCPPGGENLAIVYTSAQAGTVSFKDSNEVLSILRSHQVEVVERDFYSGPDTMLELRGLLGLTVLPALFVKGRFIGGANEVKKLERDGKLILLFAENNTTRDSNSMLETFEKRCPPGGEYLAIVYTSTQAGTVSFKDSNEVLSILRSRQVEVVERDFCSGLDTMLELRGLLGRTVLPALFVKGRFIGGANEVKKLERDGKLILLFADANNK